MRALFVLLVLSASIAAASADIVVGNGKTDTQFRALPAFRSISLEGSGTLRVHRGRQKVEITSDSNILPYITTRVSGDELIIGLKPLTSIMSSTKMEFEVTLPDLNGVDIAGSGNAYLDAFKGEAFESEISGSGGIRADLEYKTLALGSSGSGGFDLRIKAEKLDLRCTGSGGAVIKGSADRAEVGITGSGIMGGRDFSVAEARVTLSGSGGAEIKVSKSLNADVKGSGGVRYWGSPSVAQRISGSGKVAKAGD